MPRQELTNISFLHHGIHVIASAFPNIIKPGFKIDYWIIYFLFLYVIVVYTTVDYFPLGLLYSHRAPLKNTIFTAFDGVSNKVDL